MAFGVVAFVHGSACVLSDHLDRQQIAALADRAARHCARILKALRMLSSHEAARLQLKEPCARSQENENDGALPTNEEEEAGRSAEVCPHTTRSPPSIG